MLQLPQLLFTLDAERADAEAIEMHQRDRKQVVRHPSEDAKRGAFGIERKINADRIGADVGPRVVLVGRVLVINDPFRLFIPFHDNTDMLP